MSSQRALPTELLFAALTSGAASRMGDLYASSRVGPTTVVYSSTDVNRRAKEVMERAKSSGVVVDDEGTPLKIEPYSRWVIERRATDMLSGLIPKQAQDVSDLMAVKIDWAARGSLP